MASSSDSRPKGLEQSSTPCSVRSPAALTTTSWSPYGELAIADWARQGRWLGALGRGSGWWIGDWVRYGNARYGDRYGPAARVTGYDVQSLMNMAYVAGRFEVSRRRDGLSFSHHAEVASLPAEEQDLWLDRAEAGTLSVRLFWDRSGRWCAPNADTTLPSGLAETSPIPALVDRADGGRGWPGRSRLHGTAPCGTALSAVLGNRNSNAALALSAGRLAREEFALIAHSAPSRSRPEPPTRM
jgi:hypothetical protein